MRLIRRLFLLMCLAATCAAVWAAVYARREGFSESWRNAIELEFAKRGYHVDIGKLTLGAFRGLVAEDVRLFQDATRTQEFAYIDDVFLDVDLSRILRKQVSVNTLDVQKASLSLPLDPTRPRRLHVTDLSGRIVITESVIEIVKAEASVAGVDLEVKGSLVRPPLGEEKEPAGDPREREAAFNERRRQFLRFLREFETYDFDGARPRVAIEFRGDLHDLATLTATARVAAPAFKKQGQTYQVEGLDALVRFDGRENRAHLEELAVRDAKGLFQATGEWNREANRLDFSATSTADIAGLTGLFWNDKKLGEVVFFTPPAIEATGHLDFDLFPTPVRGFPGELIGEVRAERFVTRGTVFSGAKFGFSLAGERFYLRNLRLDHKTGVAFLNLKYEPGKGDQTIQYQTEIKLDPLVFRPFFDERGRKIIDSWNFGEASSIYIAAVGQGETWKFTSWKNRGVIDLRQFRLNGVDFLELETDYESDGINQWFRNVSLARPEGKIVAEVAQNDRAARTWDVKGVVSTVDLVEGARAFNPKLSKALEKYRHSSPPTIRLAGRLDGRRNEEVGDQPRRNELTVSFSGGGDAQYDFLGKTLTLSDPVGEVVISGSRVHLTRLTASVFGGRIDLRYDVPNVRTPEPPFQMQATVRGVPLERVTRHYGEKGDITGSVDLDLDLSGKVGRIDSFQGGGKARISEGYLFAIPVLGPLGALLPGQNGNASNGSGRGNIAKEASATFRLENGVITSRDLEALTRSFCVKAAGSVSLVDQSVDLEAVVNTRGELSSTVLTPVSELLTYSCTGTIREPVWKPKHISNLGKVPATLISELTNIPVEGLKKLGQIGQELFTLPERALNLPGGSGGSGGTAANAAPEASGSGNGNGNGNTNGTPAANTPPRERRFPWGGRPATGETGASPAPRRLFPRLTE
jgi:hypothetical protein